MTQQVRNYIENNTFFSEVKKALDEEKTVRIRVRGNSMLPFIRHNDCVILASPAQNQIRKGAIVVAQTDELGFVMHRIVKIKDKQITLLGDGNVNQFEHTDFARVIALVIRYERGKRTIDSDSLGMRLIGLLWYMVHPWRKKIVTISWKIKTKLFN